MRGAWCVVLVQCYTIICYARLPDTTTLLKCQYIVADIHHSCSTKILMIITLAPAIVVCSFLVPADPASQPASSLLLI